MLRSSKRELTVIPEKKKLQPRPALVSSKFCFITIAFKNAKQKASLNDVSCYFEKLHLRYARMSLRWWIFFLWRVQLIANMAVKIDFCVLPRFICLVEGRDRGYGQCWFLRSWRCRWSRNLALFFRYYLQVGSVAASPNHFNHNFQFFENEFFIIHTYRNKRECII